MHALQANLTDIEQFVPSTVIMACGFDNPKQARTALRRRAEVSSSIVLSQVVADASSYCWRTIWNKRNSRLVKSHYYSHFNLQWSTRGSTQHGYPEQ